MAHESWAVTVEINGESILTIGNNHLAGKDLTPEDEQAIRNAARHLLSFVGEDQNTDPMYEPFNVCDGETVAQAWDRTFLECQRRKAAQANGQ